jgi:MoaA/NifB/PqqE/SkfB family radical SAM enzyme
MTTTTAGPVTFLELEVSTYCQLQCSHCYNSSGPDGDTGSMTVPAWKRVITEAAACGVKTVQIIGGEPTLYPALDELARFALAAGLEVDIYTNLVHVTDAHWELFTMPGVSLGTSWYAANPEKHAEITGTEASYYRTRVNIVEALLRKIPLRAGIVEVVDGQDVDAAEDELRQLGVKDVAVDHARAVGRASGGRATTLEDLCGRCGDGRAAISSHGALSPCVLGRHLVAGNIKDAPLGVLLNGAKWHEIVDSVPRRDASAVCTPADNHDCDPARTNCNPSKGANS